MIKRIIACLTICLIVTGLISPVFSHASAMPQPNWSDPGISEIINISDLTNWMLNGGTYDVSTYTDAESFMNDYYAARTKTRLEGADYQVKSSFGLEQQYYQAGDSAYSHPLDINRVISSSFRDHSGYGQRFSAQVNEALLSSGHLYDTKIPLLNEIEFANFVGYNYNALNLYKSSFINDSVPQPSIPAEYVQYISDINGNTPRGFFWQDSTSFKWYADTQNRNVNFDPKSISYWVGIAGSLSDYHTNILGGANLFTIYINEVNGSYNISGISTRANIDFSGTGIYGSAWTIWKDNNDNFYIQANSSGNPTDSLNFTRSENNLISALNYVNANFKNINLFVNGDPWLLIGQPSTITPEFPDAIGGEDLPSTTWPVHRPLAPYFITAPGMLQAIQDAIDDDGELDIDDLKPYLTDENGDPVPDPQFDPEPIPIPVPDPVNPDVVPGLPVLPAIPPDMPGFNGVSVLAEIINFTNQSLPTSLIVTFWGIVFGIVILGLIKILHK